MSAPHVLVLAQGDGRRWDGDAGPYLQDRKHVAVRVDHVPVLHDTVRKIAEISPSSRVVVVGPARVEYAPPGAELVTLDDPHPSGTSMDKLIATVPLWSPDRRTVILWGDVFHTREALATILRHRDEELHYFRRPYGSTVTGKLWDESFAVSFGPDEHHRVLGCALLANERSRDPRIRTHYAVSLGLDRIDDVSALRYTPGQTVINDATDDIDSPAEYERFAARMWSGRLLVVAPWRESGCEWRSRSAAHVRRWWEAHGVELVEGSCGEGWFNRAEAVNAAVRAAAGEWDVVIVADMDTRPARFEQVAAAAYTAHQYGELVIGFDRYCKLAQRDTLDICAEQIDAPRWPASVLLDHVSGLVAVPRALWSEVGGFDERFHVWGAEDRCFVLACGTLAGRWEPLRLAGDAYHLWHPVSSEAAADHPVHAENRALAGRYQDASGRLQAWGYLPRRGAGIDLEPDVAAMRALLAEPGGPRS